jgi:hypothetical protein
VRQTVDSASLDRVPIDVTVLLTAFPAARAVDHEGNLVTAAVVRRLLLPEDRLRVVTIDAEVRGRVVIHDYSFIADPMVKTWNRARAIGANGIAFGNDYRRIWGVALADGLFYALAWPVSPDRRHVVVAFSDGWDTASALEMETLPKLAAHSDAVLHFAFWRSPGEDSGPGGGINYLGDLHPVLVSRWRTSFEIMDDVVGRTGGRLHRTSNADETLTEIIADFRSSYLLRYTPRGVPLAGWHELKVKVTKPGSFTIRARKGYEGS